jgi:hypothetical protein
VTSFSQIDAPWNRLTWSAVRNSAIRAVNTLATELRAIAPAAG